MVEAHAEVGASEAEALRSATDPALGAPGPPPRYLAAGNPGVVVAAAIDAVRAGRPAVLALVLETEGSTYSRAGAMALFDGTHHAGWLSGGCLEPELARRAAVAGSQRRLDWIEIDTRDDAHLFSGGALGCRGRLRIALLPLAALPGIERLLAAWLDGGACLQVSLAAGGGARVQAGAHSREWELAAAPVAWDAAGPSWSLSLAPPPEVLLLGAGPETQMLLGLMHELGWRTTVVEQGERWGEACSRAHARHDHVDIPLRDAGRFAAALAMHHNFERDRDALAALSASSIPFVGLLGPRRRREDLVKLLAPGERRALAGRLYGPVGLALGGQGPEAIALSIAAQLQQWRARTGVA